jgi:hypothetical protein
MGDDPTDVPAAPAPARGGATPTRSPAASPGTLAGLKDAFIEEVRRTNAGLYQMTVAQAHQIEVDGGRIVFSFAPARRMGKDQLEKNRGWLEPLATRVAGRRMLVVGTVVEPTTAPTQSVSDADRGAGTPAATTGPSEDLKAEAAADPGMQTLLELMPLEIKDVERL